MQINQDVAHICSSPTQFAQAAEVIYRQPSQLSCPLIPVDCPYLSGAGPDFLAAAWALRQGPPVPAEPEPEEGKKKAKKKEVLPLPKEELAWLYWRALYGGLVQPFHLLIEHKGRRVFQQFVPGGWLYEPNIDEPGPIQADVMVVGKHPGAEEIAQAANFIGESSVYLHRALEELGATELAGEWYTTNVVRHAYFDPAAGAMPTRWIQNCKPLLEQELMLVQPKYILCYGAEATKALFGKKAILSTMAGRAHVLQYRAPDLRSGATVDLRDFEAYEEREALVLVSLHPAAVYHDEERYDEFRHTMVQAVAMVQGTPPCTVEEDIDHAAIRTMRDLRQSIDSILAADQDLVIAWDAEWHGRHYKDRGAYLRTVQYSHRGKFARCVVLHDETGEYVFDAPREEVGRELGRLAAGAPGRSVRNGGHYFKADIPWIREFLGLDLTCAIEAPRTRLTVTADDGARFRVEPWERIRREGGFDTGLMAHAVYETADTKLEIIAARLVGTPMYNDKLVAWKKDYCKKNGLKDKELEGYGQCPEDILIPYGAYDADATRRCFDVLNGQNGEGGLLSGVGAPYGLDCYKQYWITQQLEPCLLEIEETGLAVDFDRAAKLTEAFLDARQAVENALRQAIHWGTFNFRSTPHCKELLYGIRYNPRDKQTGERTRLRPEGAAGLDLTPIKATGKGGKAWDKIVAKGQEDYFSPATDKETLGILFHQLEQKYRPKEEAKLPLTPVEERIKQQAQIVKMLRDCRFVDQVLKTFLRPPKERSEEEVPEEHSADPPEFDGGVLGQAMHDGKLHSRFYLAETNRLTSSSPNVQNFSKRRDDDYQRILGHYAPDEETGELKPKGDYLELLGTPRYQHTIRSILRSDPGTVFVDFDLQVAEVAGLAWLADDAAMMEDVRVSMLPDGHPDKVDIHCKTAVQAFKLDCPPTKKALKAIGRPGVRVAAKNVRFGVPYDRRAPAIARQCMEEGTVVTVAECEALVRGYHEMYPNGSQYLTACAERPISPGWMRGVYGTARRFPRSTNPQR
ncbi:MAG TPA: DNA polymerase, partial [Gemmatimonadales bacterium]|nr:DNA polymerase [Gemmatimonadales bacterium]